MTPDNRTPPMDFTPLRIRLPFGSEEEFIARYGVHVGRDGFFLATRAPKDVGARLAFELVLADGSPLLSGEGVVARTVAGTRAGMVVRFLRLDGAGAALVDRIVAGRAPSTPESPADIPLRPAPPSSPSETPTWPGDPTRDVARIAGLDGVPARPKLRPPEPATPTPPPSFSSSDFALSVHDAPTWPGDPTRDVVRIEQPPKPRAQGAPPARAAAFPVAPSPPEAAPAEKLAQDVPFHLRPTPAFGVPDMLTAAETRLHTAVTPVRGTPALGPEVIAFLTPTPLEPMAGTPSDAAPAKAVPQAEPTLPAASEPPSVPGKGADEAAEDLPDATKEVVTPPRPVPQLPQPPLLAPSPPAAPASEAPPMAPSPPPQPAQAPRSALLGEAIPLPAPSTAQPLAPPRAPPKAELPPAETRTEAAPATVQAAVPVRAPGASAEPALVSAVLGLDVGTELARLAFVHDGTLEVVPAEADGNAPALLCRLVRDAHGVLRVLSSGEPEEALWVGNPVTLLGTRADSPAIRTLVRRWPVPVVADERGEVAFDWGGVTVTAVELVATLLRALRATAERRTERSCTHTVLVVPAAFTLLQRARFREAGERAGLTVLRLLNAPTAAALAFAHNQGMARRRVLVWRMGAATCDAAVVAVSGNDLDVVSSGGDSALGGVNFDEQLALGLDKTARSDPARLRTRVAQAERCKQALSTSERGLLPPVASGEPVIEVSRGELELRTAALVERSVLLAQDVLKAAGLSAESLDALVLSGGMAELPHVRRAVEAAFGKTAEPGTQLGAGPSLGAALLGATLSGPTVSERARSNVVEVLGVPLEAVAPEFGHQRAFERNTRLPAEKTLTLTLPSNQPLEVQLFQGVARAPDPRSFLGLLQSAGVERAGEWALHLGLSADGLLQAAVTPPGGKRRPLLLQPAPMPSAAAAGEASPPEADPGARLLGGLKRLFSKK